MQIRVGYELIYDCPQPTPMVLMLNIHHTRANDIVVPDRMIAEPFVPMTSYRDGFGNWCTRIVAPAGRLRLSADARAERHGRARRDRAVGAPARRGRSSRGVARVPARKPLLRDRSADRRSRGTCSATSPTGARPRPGDLRLRPSPHHVQLPGRAIDENGVGGSPGRQRRLPRLRASGDRVLPLHEHPGPLLHRLSRRYRHPAALRSDGFCRLVRGLHRRAAGTPSIARNNIPRIGRVLIARGRDATDVAISNTFGPNTLAGFRVWTDEVRSPLETAGLRQSGWDRMRLLTVRHVTIYRYSEPVRFGEHRMMFRPRESHDLRLVSTKLDILPRPSDLRWLHDVFDNSVAIATFDEAASELRFDSTVTLEHIETALPDYALDARGAHLSVSLFGRRTARSRRRAGAPLSGRRPRSVDGALPARPDRRRR